MFQRITVLNKFIELESQPFDVRKSVVCLRASSLFKNEILTGDAFSVVPMNSAMKDTVEIAVFILHSLKFTNCTGTGKSCARTAPMTVCSSSRLLPETRMASP